MQKWMITALCILAWMSPALCAQSAQAAAHEIRIPLIDGKIDLSKLSHALLADAHLSRIHLPQMSIDVRGIKGVLFIQALNQSLGDGCRLSVSDDALVLHLDTDKLPHELNAAKSDVRAFTADEWPDATAKQTRQFGLLLPANIDATKPMIVLVHGLDCDRTNWSAMADLLQAHGYQVAYFTYPSDQPLADSAKLLAQHMAALRETYPDMATDIIAHSMGSLVARAYVEGDAYAGGVTHLILLGPPNHGSKWANYRLALEVEEHYDLWRHNPDWRPSWMITDGLGEAGRDLTPGSKFLTELNSRPRRAGVAYTIIAGSHHPARRVEANLIEAPANWLPQSAASLWGIRQTASGLHRLATNVRSADGTSDGPVSVDSTRLEGVKDYVLLPTDHCQMYMSCDGKEPAAWNVVRDRLADPK
ncbi:MAG TPA: hypothetical protein VIL86_00655 [Tepidisphaeraceae bacterium]|jgi:pimeloyl-ACP methyl ester carboxylesterase